MTNLAVGNQIEILQATIDMALVDPDWFCAEILQSPNDLWQSEMINAIADLDRIELGIPTLYNHNGLLRFTIRAFHGPGKTHFLAKLAHWWNFTRRGVIPCTAPKLEQLKTRTWREFRKILNGSTSGYRELINVDATRIQWCGDPDWCMNAESASTSENLAGYHDDNLLFLVEEASGVDENMFPTIEGALTSDGAILVLIGNPTKTTGEFYNSHTKPGVKDLYYTKHIKHHETKRVSKKWIDGMIAKYGRDSVVVKVRVFGEFVDTEKNQLLALDWIEEARVREYTPTSSYRVRVSCDVSDGGVDESIIMVAFHYIDHVVFKKMYRYSFESSKAPIKTAEKVIEHFYEWGGKLNTDDDEVVDSIGVGAGTTGYLMKKKHNVIPHKGGSTIGVTKEHRNKRAQVHIAFRNALRDGTVSFDEDFCSESDWDDVLGQFCAIRSKPGIEKVEDIETKEEFVRREKKSPDILDTATMQLTDDIPSLVDTSVDEETIQVAPSVASTSDW